MIENEHEIGVHDATRHRPDRAIEFFVFFFRNIYSKFMVINFRSKFLKTPTPRCLFSERGEARGD